ncbi:copper homeostasis periplasmic binding protein CopC [Jiella sp. M17.18]|uniref:copper homeostasis periplasmic binding protein CopC n=1 Tax=Jiella sp. M17.18 TaxID=3234247 RepID=UPI0034E002D5
MIRSKTIALALVASTLLAAPAFAHAHLKFATPAQDATLEMPPSQLDLTFTEGLNLSFTGVILTGPHKKVMATGRERFAPGTDTTLAVPIIDQLEAGTYTVQWHALSTDGHKSSGSYRFTVKP